MHILPTMTRGNHPRVDGVQMMKPPQPLSKESWWQSRKSRTVGPLPSEACCYCCGTKEKLAVCRQVALTHSHEWVPRRLHQLCSPKIIFVRIKVEPFATTNLDEKYLEYISCIYIYIHTYKAKTTRSWISSHKQTSPRRFPCSAQQLMEVVRDNQMLPLIINLEVVCKDFSEADRFILQSASSNAVTYRFWIILPEWIFHCHVWVPAGKSADSSRVGSLMGKQPAGSHR